MSLFYQEMQDLAGTLLGEFDQGGMALVVITPGDGPQHNPGPPTQTDRPFPGAARGVSAENLADSLVQATDLAVIMPGTLTPSMQDKIRIGGQLHSIVKISAKPATGIVAAYEVIVRK